MKHDVKEILIDRHRIARQVALMAADIAAAFADQDELVIMPVLTGSIIFLADLVRHLPLRMRIDVMAVSSYAGQTAAVAEPQILYPASFNVAGRPVLVVDDILDSGRTLKTVSRLLLEQGAASVKTAVLLRKQIAESQHAAADFIGFEIPNVFVVGYGLDYNNYYRNLPDLAVLHDRVVEQSR